MSNTRDDMQTRVFTYYLSRGQAIALRMIFIALHFTLAYSSFS
jgi:hypothetical protein